MNSNNKVLFVKFLIPAEKKSLFVLCQPDDLQGSKQAAFEKSVILEVTISLLSGLGLW